MNLQLYILWFVLVLCWERSNAFRCFNCTHEDGYCHDETFRADKVPTVECNTTCMIYTVTILPGFKEIFQLFDKNSDSSISFEEANKVLTVGKAMEDKNSTTKAEFQELLDGHNADVVQRKCWKNHYRPGHQLGCSDPVSGPNGYFENVVTCYCKTDKCNGPTQTNGASNGPPETNGAMAKNLNSLQAVISIGILFLAEAKPVF